MSMVDMARKRLIIDGLKDLGVEAGLMPPFEAAVPGWGRWIEFGEVDEGKYPYRLDLTDEAATVSDDCGDMVAVCALEAEQYVAGVIALCNQVMNRGEEDA